MVVVLVVVLVVVVVVLELWLEVVEELLVVVVVAEELLEGIIVVKELLEVVTVEAWLVFEELLNAVIETLVIKRLVVGDRLEVWIHDPEEQIESAPHWTEFVQLKLINLLVRQ